MKGGSSSVRRQRAKRPSVPEVSSYRGRRFRQIIPWLAAAAALLGLVLVLIRPLGLRFSGFLLLGAAVLLVTDLLLGQWAAVARRSRLWRRIFRGAVADAIQPVRLLAGVLEQPDLDGGGVRRAGHGRILRRLCAGEVPGAVVRGDCGLVYADDAHAPADDAAAHLPRRLCEQAAQSPDAAVCADCVRAVRNVLYAAMAAALAGRADGVPALGGRVECQAAVVLPCAVLPAGDAGAVRADVHGGVESGGAAADAGVGFAAAAAVRLAERLVSGKSTDCVCRVRRVNFADCAGDAGSAGAAGKQAESSLIACCAENLASAETDAFWQMRLRWFGKS